MVVLGLDKVEHFAHNVKKKVGHEVHKIEHNVAKDVKKAGTEIKKVGVGAAHGVEHVVEATSSEVGKIGSQLEHDLLPSSTAIIGESAIILGGLAIAGILVLKFL